MADTHETIADIIAEMRIFKCRNLETGELELCNAIANHLADRLEAARKRELSKNASKNGADFGQLGDVAKSLKTVDLRFDICRDIEQVLKIGRDYQNKDGYRGAHYDTVKLLCDAIEYQQEQLETKTEVGDAAKLREALDESRRIASGLGGCRLNDYWKLNEIVRVCDAALAAPARNCDRPECATTKAAQDVWRREDGGKTAYYEWLLATATEQEGGAK